MRREARKAEIRKFATAVPVLLALATAAFGILKLLALLWEVLSR
jgi:hypothetical protein